MWLCIFEQQKKRESKSVTGKRVAKLLTLLTLEKGNFKKYEGKF